MRDSQATASARKRDDQAAAMRDSQAIAEEKLKRDGQAAAMRARRLQEQEKRDDQAAVMRDSQAIAERDAQARWSGGCNARQLGDYRSRRGGRSGSCM